MKHRFEEAKKVFIDEVVADEYIELESSTKAYLQLEQSLNKSSKLVLLFGEPGTGKTMLLSRLYSQLKHQMDLHLIDTPSGTRREFYEKLFYIFTGQRMPSGSTINLETFVEYAKKVKEDRRVIILLDEAQMYPTEMLEEVRILSDTGSIKFVISLHKTVDEDVIARKHFQSRIWETIELKNADRDELRAYIYKRLIKHNQMALADQFKDRHFKLIHRLTKGNFRECNKLLYTTFDIADYYDRHNPKKIPHNQLPMKIIEMAAIRSGLIDV
ncbi:ATP-binding protein [Nitratifractor salsuginis]|uniref:AAA ATPase n=1 Tax=Nitratifractor salsuginis (strain DSM 16511 / JCM 12458 / E9I37-1) TaxID=749222 RepID=E6X1X6_NITSE|nr:ATP-binding protein [Nitratifractor salsuginis]ADV45984.1 AAA ATPase [Nitratifractor salsuginis DSM 16511]